jgi:hypothetical protein
MPGGGELFIATSETPEFHENGFLEDQGGGASIWRKCPFLGQSILFNIDCQYFFSLTAQFVSLA